MKEEDAAAIRGLPLFREMRDETFSGLVAAGFLQRFPPGVVLIEQSEQADFLHIVVEGTVEMFATSDGRDTTIEIVRPLGVFILAAVLSDEVYLQSARTLERSRVLLIPAGQVRSTMRTDPAFMQAIVMELSRGYRRAIREVKNLKLRTGAERLANWLLRAEAEQGGLGRAAIPVEKRILASRLGMTPENLSRAFASLRAYGVSVSGARVELADRLALARFAKPDPLIDDRERVVPVGR
jgi:CRP/FNR family transcriptional activator FtrB